MKMGSLRLIFMIMSVVFIFKHSRYYNNYYSYHLSIVACMCITIIFFISRSSALYPFNTNTIFLSVRNPLFPSNKYL